MTETLTIMLRNSATLLKLIETSGFYSIPTIYSRRTRTLNLPVTIISFYISMSIPTTKTAYFSLNTRYSDKYILQIAFKRFPFISTHSCQYGSFFFRIQCKFVKLQICRIEKRSWTFRECIRNMIPKIICPANLMRVSFPDVKYIFRLILYFYHISHLIKMVK